MYLPLGETRSIYVCQNEDILHSRESEERSDANNTRNGSEKKQFLN